MNLLELKIRVNTAALELTKWQFDDHTLLRSSQSCFTLLLRAAFLACNTWPIYRLK